jgi:hypothetical protein
MERKIWTASELAAMTPAEQDLVFQASIVRDLNEVRPEFLARVRRRAAEHIDAMREPKTL